MTKIFQAAIIRKGYMNEVNQKLSEVRWMF